MENLLEVKNLTKIYGSYKAVKGVSFSVPKGNIVGLLGPNGAGKSTTIHMLLGITLSDGGQISYFGKDFYKNREASLQRINYASAYNTLQGRISVWENLMVFAKLYDIQNPEKKISQLIEYFEIKDLVKQRFWDLSSGQKTRVILIKSLINDPELILMDEPTASLDPDIADKTLSMIENLRKDRDLSLLYTSHNMDEVTRICDEVIFLDKGKIVAQDSPLGLTKKIKNVTLKLTFDGDKTKVENFLKIEKQKHIFNKNFSVEITTTEKQIPKIIVSLSKIGIWITDIEVQKPTLEDFFLQIARGEK